MKILKRIVTAEETEKPMKLFAPLSVGATAPLIGDTIDYAQKFFCCNYTNTKCTFCFYFSRLKQKPRRGSKNAVSID